MREVRHTWERSNKPFTRNGDPTSVPPFTGRYLETTDYDEGAVDSIWLAQRSRSRDRVPSAGGKML